MRLCRIHIRAISQRVPKLIFYMISLETRTTRTPAFWGYPRRLMITHNIESCWIPSQNKVEWPWRYRSRSSHATHLLMLVIICTKYGKNPSRTVDATEQTRFSRSRPNDLENIGQGQRSFTCDTPSNANDDLNKIWKECKQNCRFFFQGESQFFFF